MPDYPLREQRAANARKNKANNLADLENELDDFVEQLFYSRKPEDKQLLNDLLVIAGISDGELQVLAWKRDIPDSQVNALNGNALPASGQTSIQTDNVGGRLMALDVAGNPEGTGFATREDARAAGYTQEVYEFDAAGNPMRVKGLQRPIDPTTVIPVTPVSPNSAAEGDRIVEVRTSKGKYVKEVKVRNGNADPTLEAFINVDTGTVDHFVQKQWLVGRTLRNR